MTHKRSASAPPTVGVIRDPDSIFDGLNDDAVLARLHDLQRHNWSPMWFAVPRVEAAMRRIEAAGTPKQRKTLAAARAGSPRVGAPKTINKTGIRNRWSLWRQRLALLLKDLREANNARGSLRSVLAKFETDPDCYDLVCALRGMCSDADRLEDVLASRDKPAECLRLILAWKYRTTPTVVRKIVSARP
jgi:hypothetical protein